MNKRLNVLVVEDSEIDCLLLLRQLQQAAYDALPLRVDTEHDFVTALKNTPWDLVLCDYQMPMFSASRALAVLIESGLDIPFIVVSGHIETQKALELMRQGAKDYLLKEDLARLGPVIARELAQAQTRQQFREAVAAREQALLQAKGELEQRVQERTAELQTANDRLRELDRLKSEFLATMSHELRTPLNSIIGFTSLVKEELTGPLNSEQKKQLSMVYNQGKHLLSLINDLLDLSRIEAGRVKLDLHAFDFAGVVAETVAQIKPLAQAKRLVFRQQLPPGAIPLYGDRRRSLQVLLNLVHNAVKFTDKGSVDIVVRVTPDRLLVDVLDTGVGVRPEDMQHLFEAFRQLDGSSRRTHDGTGLGLYLCRKLLTLMGGTIKAHSVFGQGSRLCFELPRQPHTQHTAEPSHASCQESNHSAGRG